MQTETKTTTHEPHTGPTLNTTHQPRQPRAKRAIAALALLLPLFSATPALTADTARYVVLYATEVDGTMQYNWGVHSLVNHNKQFRNRQGAFEYNRCVIYADGEIASSGGGLLYCVIGGTRNYLRQVGGNNYFEFRTDAINCNCTLQQVGHELHRRDTCDGNSYPRCLIWVYDWGGGPINTDDGGDGPGSYNGWSAVNMIDNKKTYNDLPLSQREVLYRLTTYMQQHITTPDIVAASATPEHFSGLGSRQYTAGTSLYNNDVYLLTGVATYYVQDGELPTEAAPVPSSEGITYQWLFADGIDDDNHVKVGDNGLVEYYSSYAATTTRTLTLRAVHAASGLAAEAHFAITFDPLPAGDPLTLTATDMVLMQGGSMPANNYSLTSASGTIPYNYVQVVANSDGSVATYENNTADGTFSLTALTVGTTTITIRSYMADHSATPIEKTFTVSVVDSTTGRDGKVVTLNDIEDYRWSYYSDPTLAVRSLNPINVQIVYRGNGIVLDNSYSEAVLSTLTEIPSLDHAYAIEEGVHVGIGDESEHTFVYYKTLERSNGRTAVAMTKANGAAEYRIIPNPFAVRPTYGELPEGLSEMTAWNGWRGFLAWRIRALSGGTIRRADGSYCNIGSLIKGDELVYFQKSSSTLTGCNIDIVVELDAVWAPAYLGLVYNNAANDDLLHLNDSADMERNFGVVMENSVNIEAHNTTNLNATWSGLFPNGTYDGSVAADSVPTGRRILSDHNRLRSDTKLEYLRSLGNNMGISANYNNLVIGRGMVTEGPYTFVNIRGVEDTSAVDRDFQYTVRVESGRYRCVRLLRHEGASPNINYHLFQVRGVYGSDYDRAVGNNSKLEIATSMGGSPGAKNVPTDEVNILSFDHIVKSGTLLQSTTEGRTSESRCSWVLYLSKWTGDLNVGRRRVLMEGGRLGGIGGGVDYDNWSWDNNFIINAGRRDSTMVEIRIKGGELTREVYGGAENSPGSGGRRLVITGGTFYSWVAAGANANEEGSDRGYINGSTVVYFGGDAHLCNTNPLNLTGNPNGTIGLKNGTSTHLANSIGYNAPAGCLFGAGVGFGTPDTVKNSSGKVDRSVVVVADKAVIDGDVYGGGYKGFCYTGTTVRIVGGTVRGKVFGGSNSNAGGTVDIEMDSGQVDGGIYGGSNASGQVAGPVKVEIFGGTVGNDAQDSEHGHVFGSGYGEGTNVAGNVEVIIGSPTGRELHADSPLIYGNVYGGGHLASYTQTGHTFRVLGQNGKVVGSIFGGGKGLESDPEAAMIDGDTDVLLRGSIEVMRNVYGGGHLGKVTGNTSVKIQK